MLNNYCSSFFSNANFQLSAPPISTCQSLFCVKCKPKPNCCFFTLQHLFRLVYKAIIIFIDTVVLKQNKLLMYSLTILTTKTQVYGTNVQYMYNIKLYQQSDRNILSHFCGDIDSTVEQKTKFFYLFTVYGTDTV